MITDVPRFFYSLASRPFDKEIKSKEMFASASHQELLARLDYLREHTVGLAWWWVRRATTHVSLLLTLIMPPFSLIAILLSRCSRWP